MKRSIAKVARREKAAEKRLSRDIATATSTRRQLTVSEKREATRVVDSFVNFTQKMGIGADNPMTTATYSYNPITRIRTLLEWIHRGSWLGGVAVDVVADDMTRAGVDLRGEMKPEVLEAIEERAVEYGIWNSVNDWIKWGRLYGGSIAVLMIDGQDPSTELRLDTVGKDGFKGIQVFDRWMIDASINDLVTKPGPYLGLPKFYTVLADAPALRAQKIHHTRALRYLGVKLPYWQAVTENLWGTSVLERLYDRMTAFDSATTGAAQLVYKAYIRTYAIEQLREVIGSGGAPLDGLVKYIEMMRRFQGIEGITLIDSKDKMETMQSPSFSGLGDALTQFGQQLSGALQIPLIRLFGQSPAGFNTGESDLRVYYDGIKQRQDRDLKGPITTIYRALTRSEGQQFKRGTLIDFRGLWQLREEEKATITNTITDAISKAEDSGLISQKTAMQELRQSSKVTGIFTNITEGDIAAAEESLPPAGEEAIALGAEVKQPGGGENDKLESKNAGDLGDDKGKKQNKTEDSVGAVTKMKRFHNLDVVIENTRFSHRYGRDWDVSMPADYGYIRRTRGEDNMEVDCYVGRDHDSPDVWVISQVDPKTQEKDEDKVMLGYKSMPNALDDYVSGYTDGTGWDRIGNIQHMAMDDFKSWLSGKSE